MHDMCVHFPYYVVRPGILYSFLPLQVLYQFLECSWYNFQFSSHSAAWHFAQTMEFFAVQKLFFFFLLYEVHLLIFGLNVCSIGVLFRKFFPAPMSPSLFLTFSFIRFKSLCLFRPWIHFVLRFVQGSRCGSISILLHAAILFDWHSFLKMLPTFF